MCMKYENKVIEKENPYHIANRLCATLQETKRYQSVTRLYVKKEKDEFFNNLIHVIVTICLADKKVQDCPRVDVTDMDGAGIIEAVMNKLKEVL